MMIGENTRIKTPDEIKKGLDCCGNNTNYCRNDCPYLDGCHLANEFRQVERDALAYIQQLEREREALLDALKKADVYGECANCCHRDSAPADCDCECGSCKRNCRCWECRDGDKWEWRGVKLDESQESE